MSQLLRLQEGAKRVNVSFATFRRWVDDGRLPIVRIGRVIRVSEDDLEKFVGKSLKDDPAPTSETSMPTTFGDGKVDRLIEVLQPYIIQLLKDAPEYGEISIAATLHKGTIGRVRLGSEVTQVVAPRESARPAAAKD